ncbi:hypothetical protein H696_06053 [Fonticula alba]|uniref:Uncharacterized protein n=1 Tax=Fonticula alba TaxID=691883 RepID=A0A058YZY3_FONAL|nr:hypothetical protein H696_06053 [Fonticula alba]KCV67535.1 hypothetical protein H696_06053 [Fonticula alba]|eukprot:XP_009498096.1 hypothetical protein H696_06053 [Fonticula alba]
MVRLRSDEGAHPRSHGMSHGRRAAARTEQSSPSPGDHASRRFASRKAVAPLKCVFSATPTPHGKIQLMPLATKLGLLDAATARKKELATSYGMLAAEIQATRDAGFDMGKLDAVSYYYHYSPLLQEQASFLALLALLVAFGVWTPQRMDEFNNALFDLDVKLDSRFASITDRFRRTGLLSGEIASVVGGSQAIEPFMFVSTLTANRQNFVSHAVKLGSLPYFTFSLSKEVRSLQKDRFSISNWRKTHTPLPGVNVLEAHPCTAAWSGVLARILEVRPGRPAPVVSGPLYPMYTRPAGARVVWVNSPAMADLFVHMLHASAGVSGLDTESFPSGTHVSFPVVPHLVQVCLTPVKPNTMDSLADINAALDQSVIFLMDTLRHLDLAKRCLGEYLRAAGPARRWTNLVYGRSSDVPPTAALAGLAGKALVPFVDLSETPADRGESPERRGTEASPSSSSSSLPSDEDADSGEKPDQADDQASASPSATTSPVYSHDGRPAVIPANYAGHPHKVPAMPSKSSGLRNMVFDKGTTGGLKGLVVHCFGVRLDNSWTMSDWSVGEEGMTPGQLEYAVNDAVVLVELFLRYGFYFGQQMSEAGAETEAELH